MTVPTAPSALWNCTAKYAATPMVVNESVIVVRYRLAMWMSESLIIHHHGRHCDFKGISCELQSDLLAHMFSTPVLVRRHGDAVTLCHAVPLSSVLAAAAGGRVSMSCFCIQYQMVFCVHPSSAAISWVVSERSWYSRRNVAASCQGLSTVVLPVGRVSMPCRCSQS